MTTTLAFGDFVVIIRRQKTKAPRERGLGWWLGDQDMRRPSLVCAPSGPASPRRGSLSAFGCPAESVEQVRLAFPASQYATGPERGPWRIGWD